MKEISRRLQKIEAQAKPKKRVSTVVELIGYVLRAQRGEVSIRDVEVGSELLAVTTADSEKWLKLAERIAEKYNKPIDEVKRDLIERKPELAPLLQ